jgi:hypothetical protein
MLEYPLTDSIPSIVATRDRLLSKIFRFREENMAATRASAERVGEGSSNPEHQTPGTVVAESDYALLYAYVLVTGQVADELRVAAAEIESLFGVLNGDSTLLE